ncbi:MAG: hypothetical protein NC078_02475 [Ruminococcus sp.]|nr:hypothetical protein [Ruminococcus sp.]
MNKFKRCLLLGRYENQAMIGKIVGLVFVTAGVIYFLATIDLPDGVGVFGGMLVSLGTMFLCIPLTGFNYTKLMSCSGLRKTAQTKFLPLNLFISSAAAVLFYGISGLIAASKTPCAAMNSVNAMLCAVFFSLFMGIASVTPKMNPVFIVIVWFFGTSVFSAAGDNGFHAESIFGITINNGNIILLTALCLLGAGLASLISWAVERMYYRKEFNKFYMNAARNVNR